jgi:hypothetical protein
MLVITILVILNSSYCSAGFLPVAKIVNISGNVLVNNEIAKVGTEISEGSEVSINMEKDFADIKYQNGHILRLKGGVIKVQELTPKKSIIELVKGTLFNLIKKLATDETFTIKTKSVSFGVRGTQFYISQSAKESYLCVCDGIVTAKKGNKTLEVKKDEDLFINKKMPYAVTSSSKQMREMGNDIFNSLNQL